MMSDSDLKDIYYIYIYIYTYIYTHILYKHIYIYIHINCVFFISNGNNDHGASEAGNFVCVAYRKYLAPHNQQGPLLGFRTLNLPLIYIAKNYIIKSQAPNYVKTTLNPIDPNPAISARAVFPQSGRIRPEKRPFFQNFPHFSKIQPTKE